MRSSMSVLLLGLAATAAACRSVTQPDARLEVFATAAQAQVPIGETVRVDVVVTNASGRPLRIPGGAPTFVEVQDADGRVVAFGRFQILALSAPPPLTLAPSASVQDHVPWAGELAAGGRAPAGVYRLRAAVPVLESRGAYAYSAPITVDLLAR